MEGNPFLEVLETKIWSRRALRQIAGGRFLLAAYLLAYDVEWVYMTRTARAGRSGGQGR